MASVSIAVLPILLLCLFATFFVVVFVYRDASKRGMNPLAWSLVAALVPLFLGLIMYLVCRKPLVDWQCPNCGAGIDATDRKCPQCGKSFLTQCPECNFPVQRGWNACPSCGTELPKEYGQPVRAYKKDNGMIALIIIVAVVLLVLFLAIFSVLQISRGGDNSYESYGGYEGMYNITAEDMAGNTAIAKWIATCDEKTQVHVLVSTESDTCIVYLPNQDTLMRSDMSLCYVSDGSVILDIFVETTSYEDKYGYDFFLYEFAVSEDTELYVYMDGKSCDSTMTITDQDISMETWGGQEDE